MPYFLVVANAVPETILEKVKRLISTAMKLLKFKRALPKPVLQMTHPDSARAEALKNGLAVVSGKVRAEGLQRSGDSGPATTAVIRFNTQDRKPLSEKDKLIRSLNNRALPQYACASCAVSAQCPQYRPGYECAFLPFLNSHTLETMDDVLHYMKQLGLSQVQRVQMLTMMERMQGGAPSLETSESLSHAFQTLSEIRKTITELESSSVELKTSDGSILGQLFGGMGELLSATRKAAKAPLDTAMYEKEAQLLHGGTDPSDPSSSTRHDLVNELARSSDIETNESPEKSNG